MPTAEEYMRRALALAKTAEGHTSPNPMVGCVIVKDGEIISEACHEKYGEYHAERNALLRCPVDPAGADMYVTLEPCCHHGKTPPCTDIIIEKKIGRVFVGSMDSNPLVAGKGVQQLRDAGIEVETGILEKECKKLNEVFYHFIQTKKPFVVAKYAMSLDGKIASVSGDSKWVTNEVSRNEVQILRKRYKGIMAGIGTVIKDDPMLNCRIEDGVDPVRIICDSRLRIPRECKIVKTAKEIPTIVVCSETTVKSGRKAEKIEYLKNCGLDIINTTSGDEVNLKQLVRLLGERGIDSILLEGGGTLNASAFEAGIVNKVYAFVAAKIIGGRDALSPVEGSGAETMKDAIPLTGIETEQFGNDVCITGYPVYE